MTTHEPAGRHLLATLHGCPAAILDNETLLREVVARAATATGATVLQIALHHFAPHGITAMALLAESHASLHTYPERGLAFWDCFTCGATCHPETSLAILQAALHPTSITHEIVARN